MNFIAINQFGYQCTDQKTALFIKPTSTYFSVLDAKTQRTILRNTVTKTQKDAPNQPIALGDFSKITTPGTYQIAMDGLGISQPFSIDSTVYQPVVKQLCQSYRDWHTTIDADDTNIKEKESQLDATVITASIELAYLCLAFEENCTYLTSPLLLNKNTSTTPDLITIIKEQLLALMNTMSNPCSSQYSIPSQACYCAILAMSVPLLARYDSSFSSLCLHNAIETFERADFSTLAFKTPTEDTTTFLYWTTAQLYKLTGDNLYHTFLSTLLNHNLLYEGNTKHVLNFGNYAYLSSNYPINPLHSSLIVESIKEKCLALYNTTQNNYLEISTDGTEAFFNTQQLLDYAVQLYNGYCVTKEVCYKHACKSHIDYLFGKNPFNTTFTYNTCKDETTAVNASPTPVFAYSPEQTTQLIYILGGFIN